MKRLAIVAAAAGAPRSRASSLRASIVYSLQVHEPDLAERIERTRENDIFLPGISLPHNVRAGHSLEAALAEAEVVLSVMPSHAVRDVYTRMLPSLKPSMRIVSATKTSPNPVRFCASQSSSGPSPGRVIGSPSFPDPPSLKKRRLETRPLW